MPIPLTKDMNKFEFEKMINGLFNSPHIKSNATLRLPPASSASAVEVASVFTNIDSFIVERISKYDAVVGCSPWITEGSPIITAVRTKPFHSLVVSAEEGKRRVHAANLIPKNALHPWGFDFGKFVKIDDEAEIYDFEYVIPSISKEDKIYTRLHSKFLVLGTYKNGVFKPCEVLTGSFNFTTNAGFGLENVIAVLSHEIADSYARAWYQYLLIAVYQRDRTLVTQSDWIATELQSERDDAIRDMKNDPHSAYNFEIEERNNEDLEEQRCKEKYD